eukprot:1183140-Prorocentrum_minimum.AAC.2
MCGGGGSLGPFCVSAGAALAALYSWCSVCAACVRQSPASRSSCCRLRSCRGAPASREVSPVHCKDGSFIRDRAHIFLVLPTASERRLCMCTHLELELHAQFLPVHLHDITLCTYDTRLILNDGGELLRGCVYPPRAEIRPFVLAAARARTGSCAPARAAPARSAPGWAGSPAGGAAAPPSWSWRRRSGTARRASQGCGSRDPSAAAPPPTAREHVPGVGTNHKGTREHIPGVGTNHKGTREHIPGVGTFRRCAAADRTPHPPELGK